MMTTGGKAEPSNINRIFWGVVLGMTAAILMIIGGEGGASALQNAVIITGAPFAFVCFLAMLSLIRDFGAKYDQVLFQKETVLYGPSREDDSPSGPVESAGSDDD
jgi:choline-glycine betaine transporter